MGKGEWILFGKHGFLERGRSHAHLLVLKRLSRRLEMRNLMASLLDERSAIVAADFPKQRPN